MLRIFDADIWYISESELVKPCVDIVKLVTFIFAISYRCKLSAQSRISLKIIDPKLNTATADRYNSYKRIMHKTHLFSFMFILQLFVFSDTKTCNIRLSSATSKTSDLLLIHYVPTDRPQLSPHVSPLGYRVNATNCTSQGLATPYIGEQRRKTTTDRAAAKPQIAKQAVCSAPRVRTKSIAVGRIAAFDDRRQVFFLGHVILTSVCSV